MKCPNCEGELFFVSIDKTKHVYRITGDDDIGENFNDDILDTMEEYLECNNYNCLKKFNFEYKTEDWGVILRDEKKREKIST